MNHITIQKLVSLLRSSDGKNLAITLAESQKIDLYKVLNKRYQIFYKWFGISDQLSTEDRVTTLYNTIDNLKGEWTLTEKNISEVPSCIEDFQEITTLNFQYNNIRKLPIEVFKLGNLNTLYISDNPIEEIPSDVQYLTNLTSFSFNLKENKISDKLWSLPKLEWLSMDKTPLQKLPSLKNLKRLTSINLRNCQLTELPEDIGESKNISWIIVEGNQLTKLPNSLRKLHKLSWFDISKNQFTTLPDWIGELKKLNVFVIGHNQITSLPNTIIELSNLSELSMKNNQLKTLPNLLQLPRLYGMDLHNNQIDLTTLNEDFWEGGKNHLGISFTGNGIKKIPKTIKKSCATSLSFRRNLLKELPEEICKVTSLKSLDLHKNQLTSLPKNIHKLKNLESLDLGNNNFTEVPLAIFELNNLEELSFEYNQFITFPCKQIQKLPKLKKVMFDHKQYTLVSKDDKQYFETKNIEVIVYEEK